MTQLESLALRFTHTPQQTALWILDQTLLPLKEEWVRLTTVGETIEAIKTLKVRGAPLIGVAAALSLGQSAIKGTSLSQLEEEANALYAARPTAVNLMLCMNRMTAGIQSKQTPEALLTIAVELFNEDAGLCENIAANGAGLIQNGDSVLTHCNTGGLATAGIGTALGVIRKCRQQGKQIHVYVDETRPLLQGARLTTWELKKLDIPYTLITDSTAGYLMQLGKAQKIIVGCDRIAANGDVANKIGTYALAVLAQYHNIPFYVAGPYTTMDVHCAHGSQIPVEQRKADEVSGVSGVFGQISWAAEDSQVFNPAFDVTPAKLVSRWILDCGVFSKTDFQQGRVKQYMQQLAENSFCIESNVKFVQQSRKVK
ncbi:methylthioribose-1-phosphate isomerase [Nitrosomonas sp. Nm51]|uniref:S-methyl-5-thioribose-1-phosphate isomerase n=1 Tax=Nitrosomonas sp. Nm51 TaxID=133720 RepID=UPI0008C1C901|nr:S-methyl-5-thioribose-1-phosphate isomerase [Nitrosomonas sp. Nm51]SER06467.1 methylthioribose-1-phosphate isomerase [Nitrosomonas sp. Nm51]